MKKTVGSKGQAASFDMILVLLSITVFTVVISKFSGDGTLKAETLRVREDYTHSLLVSMLQCTVNSSPEHGDNTISDLIVFYFQNTSRVNQTIQEEITDHINLYTVNRRLEWVFYGNETEVLWIPEGKILGGRDISSSSAEILLPDKGKVRVYLFIKWN